MPNVSKLWCKDCGQNLRYVHPDNSRSSYCKPCMSKRNRRIRLRSYGISVSEFNILWHQQDGKCPICKDELQSGQRVHIDHDHATGAIRGLLCNACNRGIGYLGDDPDRLRAAITYLTGPA